MSKFLLINQAFVFLISVTSIWLAFWVLFANRKNKLNQTFFIMTIFIFLWVIFAYLGFSANELKKSLIWYRLNLGVVSLFFIATYFFSVYFPKKITESHFLNKIVLCLGSILFFLSVFTDSVIKNTMLKGWGIEIIFGKGKILYYGLVILLTFLILYILFKKYFLLSKEEKLKIQYFLLGVFIFALMNIVFNVIFPFFFGTVQLQHFGDYSVIFSLGFTAFAIVKRELFGIKVVLTALFVAMIAILVLLDAILLTQTPFIQIVKGIILVIFLFFGYSLIKSVLREIKLKEQLQEAYQELKKLDKAKMEFLSIASHQLRTPLTVIKGYLSMILHGDYGRTPKKVQEKIRNVYLSSERLTKLVNNLLSATRIETGKMELKFKKAPIEPIIEQAIKELEIKAKEKNLYLRFEKPKEQLPEMLIDSEKIKEAISNIIDNSIRYTQKGGVTIKCKMQNTKCKIEVSDTGTGLTEDELSKLFESFSRAATGSRLYSEGVGLGLYISKKFIEMHNGAIRAESEGKGKGSSFHIDLAMK